MTISDQLEYSSAIVFGIDFEINVMPKNMLHVVFDNPIPSIAEMEKYGLTSSDAQNEHDVLIHRKNHKYESKPSKKDREKKFTFRTEHPTGQWCSFFPDSYHIKLKRKEVGSITDGVPYKISLQVIKKDINEDGNPNCPWKWITLKKESQTLQEAKDFLNRYIDKILAKYKLYLGDEIEINNGYK
jgi:hypothetical protein